MKRWTEYDTRRIAPFVMGAYLVALGLILSGCGHRAVHRPYVTEERDRRLSYTAAKPGINDELRRLIHAGTLQIGMTKAEVTAAWGLPHSSQREGSEAETLDTWFYYQQYAVFRNGILIFFQK